MDMQAWSLVERSRALRAASARLIAESQREILRARQIRRAVRRTLARSQCDYEKTVSISLQEVLYSFPPNTNWVLGSGKYSTIMTMLLDAGTSLFEEHPYDPEGDPLSTAWLVRLTPKGVEERLRGSQAPAPCVGKGWRELDVLRREMGEAEFL